MAQICLLDPARLSQVLQAALSWRPSTSSLMVSASNGAILSYAFRGQTPDIKELRTMSTTMTAAYAIASEEVLIFEAQDSHALSVIVPVGDHIFLAVNGPAQSTSEDPETLSKQTRINGGNGQLENQRGYENDNDADGGRRKAAEDEETGADREAYNHRDRQELEEVADRLAATLRQDLAGLKWPGDI